MKRSLLFGIIGTLILIYLAYLAVSFLQNVWQDMPGRDSPTIEGKQIPTPEVFVDEGVKG